MDLNQPPVTGQGQFDLQQRLYGDSQQYQPVPVLPATLQQAP